jgi:hypothetical protein
MELSAKVGTSTTFMSEKRKFLINTDFSRCEKKAWRSHSTETCARDQPKGACARDRLTSMRMGVSTVVIKYTSSEGTSCSSTATSSGAVSLRCRMRSERRSAATPATSRIWKHGRRSANARQPTNQPGSHDHISP